MIQFAKAVILFQGLSILEESNAIQLNEYNQAGVHDLANTTKNGTANVSKNATNSTTLNLSKKAAVNATVKNHTYASKNSTIANSTLNKTNATV